MNTKSNRDTNSEKDKVSARNLETTGSYWAQPVLCNLHSPGQDSLHGTCVDESLDSGEADDVNSRLLSESSLLYVYDLRHF